MSAVERSDLPVGQQSKPLSWPEVVEISKSGFEEIERGRADLAEREGRECDALCRDVEEDRGRLAAEVEQLRAEVARVRAQVAEDIARKIRAELVCCDVYERMAPKRAEIEAQQPGWSQASAELDDAIYEHELCYWGEAAARIAVAPAESPVGAPTAPAGTPDHPEARDA